MRRFSCIVADASGVVADSDIGTQARRADPCQQSAIAISDDAGFLTGLCAHVLEGRIDVLQCISEIELLQNGSAFLCVGAVVGKFDIALNTIEESGCHGEKSIARIPIGHRTDVLVDAEDLLDDDEPGDRFRGRAGDICIEFVAGRQLSTLLSRS